MILLSAEFDDAASISNYITVNRDFLKPLETKREEAFFTELGWQQRLIKLSELHKMSLGFYLLIIDADSDEMLGTISFSNISRFPFYACNVGYSLAEQAQGKQIMTRALKMACDYMFNEQNLHRVMASYMPHNKRSEAVLQRLGFVHEGQA
ncbi:MAG: GNAT family N-acetyltransferase, partial [Vibrio fluvialis]